MSCVGKLSYVNQIALSLALLFAGSKGWRVHELIAIIIGPLINSCTYNRCVEILCVVCMRFSLLVHMYESVVLQ